MSVVRFERSDAVPRARNLTGCTGKVPMPQAVAAQVANKMRSKHQVVRAYACKHCGMWHVGGDPAFPA